MGFLDFVDHAQKCVGWTLEYHGRMNTYSEYNWKRVINNGFKGPGQRSAFVGPDPDLVYSEIFGEYFKAQKYLREQMKEEDENLPKLLLTLSQIFNGKLTFARSHSLSKADEIYKCELSAGNTDINATLDGILRDITVSLSKFQQSEEKEAEQHDEEVIQQQQNKILAREEQNTDVADKNVEDNKECIQAFIDTINTSGQSIVSTIFEDKEEYIPAFIHKTEASEQSEACAIVEDKGECTPAFVKRAELFEELTNDDDGTVEGEDDCSSFFLDKNEASQQSAVSEEEEEHIQAFMNKTQAVEKLAIITHKEQHPPIPIVDTKDSSQYINSAVIERENNNGLVIVEDEGRHIPVPIDNTEASEKHTNNAIVEEEENIDGLVIVDPITINSDDDFEEIQCLESSFVESHYHCDESIMAIEHDDDNWVFA
ncbi:hypothetical protein DID88_002098 [Monilinia fructigena]|uniref:Uncharacterized protein n=1 Tax=Monilinia fructigena TaxID=38457 RepID=A0A395IW10_9HELO|nr:hypothetical protein DID88_002098 [Monilinia fructigena]